MADSVFPCKKKSLFVKTYSKVRPLLPTFAPKFQAHSGDGTPTIQSGKPFPFILHAGPVAPTLAPANSPSSDSSNSETCDVEMMSTEFGTSPSEDGDDKIFATLTPGSKKLSCSKKRSKRKSCNPLQSISNAIKVIHSSKAVAKRMGSPKRTASPKRKGSPVMWTCTQGRQQAQLPCIQESDLESPSSDGPDGTKGKSNKPQKPAAKIRHGKRCDTHDVKMLESGDLRAGRSHFPSQLRDKNSPMVIQGRGVFGRNYSATLGDQQSTQLYGSTAGSGDLSTAMYTCESEEISDDSTLMTSDVCTDSQCSSGTETLKDEYYSDIEILRDIPDTAAVVMKQLTPKVAQLILPDAEVRTAHKKTSISTAKAMPKRFSSVGHNKKPAVVRQKNSTLIDGISALDIKEYGPMNEISDISEETSRPDFVSSKITSTPSSKDRNTMVHQRFIPNDVSSIEGDACALPSIEAMQSLSSTALAENTGASLCQKKPGSALSKPPIPTPRTIDGLSTIPNISATLSIKGRKALPLERKSHQMSPRVSFRQYPTAATKTTSSTSVWRSTPMFSAKGNVSGNTSSSSSSTKKHVKFVLSTKAHEFQDEPAPDMSCSIVHLPELSPSSSILKKVRRGNTSATSDGSSVLNAEDLTRPLSNKETNRAGGTSRVRAGTSRVTSTPQRSSRRSKRPHMLDYSFDVSAVVLPSCNDEDLITKTSKQTAKTSAKAPNQHDQEDMAQKPMDCEVSTSVPSEVVDSVIDTHKDRQTNTHHEPPYKIPATCDQDLPTREHQQEHSTQAQGDVHCTQSQGDVHGTQTQGDIHGTQAQGDIHSTQAQGDIHGTQAQGDIHGTQTQGDIHGTHQVQGDIHGTQAQGDIHGTQAQGDIHGTQTQGDIHCTQTQGDIHGTHQVQGDIHGTQAQGDIHGTKAQGDINGTRAKDSLRDTRPSLSGTQYGNSEQDITNHGTQDYHSLTESRHPVHTTPRSQLKRSSPNGDLPGRPNKKRFLEKEKSDSAVDGTTQTCHHASQKCLPRQKRLEYVDKAVGPPECIISRLGPTMVKPARFWQYVNLEGPDYESIKNMPQDILETLPDNLAL